MNMIYKGFHQALHQGAYKLFTKRFTKVLTDYLQKSRWTQYMKSSG